jgi:hypothetical protein
MMELTTIKVSNLTIDVETAKELFENLFAFFDVWDKNPEEFVDDRSILLASGTLEGKQPVDLNIYLNPHDLGEVEFGCESTE